MDLFRDYLDETKDRRKTKNEDESSFYRYLLAILMQIYLKWQWTTDLSSDKTRITVNVAVNYGGRQNIKRKEIASRIQVAKLCPMILI